MSQKIARLSYWLVPALCVSLCPLALHAQESPAKEKAEHKAAHHAVSVTGCLQKGDEPGEFSITGADSKTWDLRSRSVKLAEHVGHKVTVTGFQHHESKAEEAKEEKMKKDKEAAGKGENADLRVTSLKMVSNSCGN
jgi:hypothetical protein